MIASRLFGSNPELACGYFAHELAGLRVASIWLHRMGKFLVSGYKKSVRRLTDWIRDEATRAQRELTYTLRFIKLASHDRRLVRYQNGSNFINLETYTNDFAHEVSPKFLETGIYLSNIRY